MTTWPDKHPDEELDYQLDWSSRLAEGEVIETATWEIEAGLVKLSDSHTDTTTTIWLSGGTPPKTAHITCTVETDQGRTMQEAVDLTIRNL